MLARAHADRELYMDMFIEQPYMVGAQRLEDVEEPYYDESKEQEEETEDLRQYMKKQFIAEAIKLDNLESVRNRFNSCTPTPFHISQRPYEKKMIYLQAKLCKRLYRKFLRVHNADIRTEVTEDGEELTLLHHIQKFTDFAYNVLNSDEPEEQKHELIEMVEFFMTPGLIRELELAEIADPSAQIDILNRYNTHNLDLGMILNHMSHRKNTLLHKALSRLQPEHAKKILGAYMNSDSNDAHKQFHRDFASNNDIVEKTRNFTYYCMRIISSLTDLYTVARMMKIIWYYPNPPRMIAFVGGRSHAENIARMIITMQTRKQRTMNHTQKNTTCISYRTPQYLLD